MADVYSEPLGDAFKYNPDYHRLAEFVGVDRRDREDFDVANKLSLIRDWAGLTGKSDSHEDALKTIEGLRRKLGYQVQGKTLVNELYRHIRLDMQSRQKTPQTVPNASTNAKFESKPVTKPTQGIKGAVAQAVQQTVSDIVKQTVQDKKLIKMVIINSVKDVLK